MPSRKDKKSKPIASGRVHSEKVTKFGVPKSGTKVYIFTSAQNNTHINKPVWENLLAYAKYRKAKIFCASYTYNQNAFGKLDVKRNTVKRDPTLWYDEAIESYLCESDKDIEIAPGLVWCGRTNTSPSASNPLSGLETYTGRASSIFPHAKLAMESIPSGKYEPTKFTYTTGTVTLRNYIQKREGLRAEKFHSYGALIVEVNRRGWFVRQLQADRKNRICDLDVIIENGKVRKANVVEAINWGDIHVSHLDPLFKKVAWGKGGIIDQLKPKVQYLNDTLTFDSRNHWDIENPDKQFAQFIADGGNVEKECQDVVDFIKFSNRPFCASKVVYSNHDAMLERWLRETNPDNDPVNAIFWLKLKLSLREAQRDKVKNYYSVEHALRILGCPPDVHFMRADEDSIICRNQYHEDGINNVHGHLGIDGGKGSSRAFTKLSRAINSGHSHKATIVENVYTAGVCTVTEMGYNRGPGTWSNSHVITYTNGTRCVITYWNGGFRG